MTNQISKISKLAFIVHTPTKMMKSLKKIMIMKTMKTEQ